MDLGEMAEGLAEACATVTDIVAYSELGEDIDPPAAIVGPPLLRFDGYNVGPSEVEFTIYVVVGSRVKALSALGKLVTAVQEAVHEHVVWATVEDANPTTFPVGNQLMPAYEIRVVATRTA